MSPCLLVALSMAAIVAPVRADELGAQAAQPPAQPSLAQSLIDSHSDIAWRTLSRGNLERAEAMFRDILQRDPDRPREIAGLSAALARQGKFEDAIGVLDAGVARFPNSALLASALGQAYLQSQDNQAAMHWLERAYDLDPAAPDVPYFLGSSYLRCELPLSALDVLCGAETSRQEMAWSQDLAIGTAFSQLGLECQASGYFMGVYEEARDTPLAERAMQLQDQMDDALLGRPYWRGSLKVTERYDDNPGIVPVADAMSVPLSSQPSAGNLYALDLAHDLVREYNYDLTAGYSFLHTNNYVAHQFDLVDNGLYLASVRRGYWRGRPTQTGVRLDYDHMFLGSEDFLQRLIVTPSLTLIESDWDATVLMVRYTLFDFLGQGALNGTPFDLDGDTLLLGIDQRRQLAGRNMTLIAGYHFDQHFSEGSNYDYSGHMLRTGAEWETPLHGLRINLLGEIYFRSYENPNSIFGIFRDDEEYQALVQIVYPLGDRWRLSVEWVFDRNDSNLVTNDFRHNVIDAGIEYNWLGGCDAD
ncbi:MAG: tetratricopeptide repeat protein [Planctomycetaceae bacterium]|nr:tetratricopeptide repeat protein [Planctomycetaceae bacterium]